MASLSRLLAGAIYLGWLPAQVPAGSWEAAVLWWLWGWTHSWDFRSWKRMGHGGIKVYFFGCQSGFRNIMNWFEQFLFTRQLQDWLTHANVDWGDLKRSESIAYLWNLSFDWGSFWILVTGLTWIVSFRDPPNCSRFLARNDDSSWPETVLEFEQICELICLLQRRAMQGPNPHNVNLAPWMMSRQLLYAVYQPSIPISVPMVATGSCFVGWFV
jgi:hypothetical protein